MINVENKLASMDFTGFSKVQDSLKARLLSLYADRQRISEDDLDMVVAAGNTNLYSPENSNKIN